MFKSYRSWPLSIAGGSGDAPTDLQNVQLSEATWAKLATMLQESKKPTDPPEEIEEREQDETGDWEKPAKTAEMHATLLSGVKLGSLAGQLDKMLFGLPVGTVIVGGIPALVLTEVTDGFIKPRNADGSVNFANIVVKGVEAYLMTSRMAKGLLGEKAAHFAAAAITIQAVAAVLPLDMWVDKLVAIITRRSAPVGQRQRSVLEQAEQVIYGGDHYGSAL